jgi:hypothetical protein
MRGLLSGLRELMDWRRRRYGAPSPNFIKHHVLLRNGLAGATWVETGTYHGDSTAALARVARRVVSLEPSTDLFATAQTRFRGVPNVELLNATSEQAFPRLLPQLAGAVCFWLDGHFSGGHTFKGPNDTPILAELAAIGENLHRWEAAVVLVDDLRLFTGGVHVYGPYPPIDDLVGWAVRHGLSWHIEHDIFVARKSPGARPPAERL